MSPASDNLFLLCNILFPIFNLAVWQCPPYQLLPNNEAFNVFPSGNDLYYGSNTLCNLHIVVPDGMYVNMAISAQPSAGDSIIGKNSYLQIPITGSLTNLVAVGPNPFVITIDSSSNSDGTFQITWYLRNVSFHNQERISIESGKQPVLLKSYDIGLSAKTLIPPAGQSLAVSTASYGSIADIMLTGAFLYVGDKVTGGPLVCLYNRLNEKIPFKADSIATIVFLGTPIDAAVFTVSSWIDVSRFAQLQLAFYNTFGSDGRIVLDATNGPAAVTLYQADSSFTLFNSYITTPTNLHVNLSAYSGGVPLLNQNLLATYISTPNADNNFPQAIPGFLKTFLIEKGTISLKTGLNTNILTAKDNLQGFFMSSNYPFSSATQSDSLQYVSDHPLNLTVSLYQIDDFTIITVSTTGIYGPQTCTFSKTSQSNCEIYGTNFVFQSVSSSTSSTGGLVRYSFVDQFHGKDDDNAGDSIGIFSLIILCVICVL